MQIFAPPFLWTWLLLRLFPLSVTTMAGSLPAQNWGWLPLAVTGGAWAVFLLALGWYGRKPLFKTHR